MAEEFETLYPVEFQPGWYAHAQVRRNHSGAFVITKLHIEAQNEETKNAGLTVQTLRSVKFTDLINSALEDAEYVELALMESADYDWVNEHREKWWMDIKTDWISRGPNGFDHSLYAKTAFFYLLETRTNPTSPLVSLANRLEIERGLLAKRIDKARQLEILTRPSSGGSSNQGKAAGMLTRKGRELLGLTIEGWKP